MTELEEKYINRPLEDENLSFEQFTKLESLRNKPKRTIIHDDDLKQTFLNKRVSFYQNDKKLVGYVKAIKDGVLTIGCSGSHYNLQSFKVSLYPKKQTNPPRQLAIDKLGHLPTKKIIELKNKSYCGLWYTKKYDEHELCIYDFYDILATRENLK